MLYDYGFRTNDLNLVGHSWGSYVADELAEGIPLNAGVNVIVALDPASNTVGLSYDPNDGTVNFRAHSRFALAFHSSDTFGSWVTPKTADEAFEVSFLSSGGLSPGTAVQNHGWIREMFQNMVAGTGGVSSLFSLNRILDMAATDPASWNRPWRADQYRGVDPFEGAIYEGEIDGSWITRIPTEIRYRDKDGVERTVTELPPATP